MTKVTVQVFAALKDYFDQEFHLELEREISVAVLLDILKNMSPLSEPVLSKCRIAINENFVSSEFIIKNEERVCIIPPSSGG